MRIVKRHNYYYLQHSFRRKDKVMTKEIYLGEKIPKNIDELKANLLQKYVMVEQYKQFEQIKQGFQKEWKKLPGSIKEKELQEIAIAFTYNTNAIEGSTITLPETREIIQKGIAPHKPLYDIKETEAHAKVFLAMLQKKEEMTEQLLLHWHQEMFQETKQEIAGKYRDYGVRVGMHVPPDWQDIPMLMKRFILFFKKNSLMHPVELAAKTHYQFESIHPFGDGNGRVGRLLMNYILWHHNYPTLIIENKKKKAYYKAFAGEEKFAQYLFRTYLKAHKKYLNSLSNNKNPNQNKR